MTSAEPARPTWNTAPLWGVLALLLVVGTLGAATFVFGLLGVLSGGLVYLAAVAGGGFLAVVAFLLMAGVLYRVDRYRGANYRRIEFFE